MPHELLRLPYPLAELVLLKYPEGHYRIEIYWREGGYYEKLIETDSIGLAQEAVLKAAEKISIYTYLTSVSREEKVKKFFLKVLRF